MKRIQTLLLFVVFLSAMASAQTQLENPGFELWEDILVSDPDTIREPIDWSSLKTSDDPTLSSLAPVVLTRSQDAHTGDYSLELTNVKSFIVANGLATNGRVHPNINTDPATCRVLHQILDLHKNGHTIIITTHDLEKVVAHAQRLVVMAKGRVVKDGIPTEVIGGIERYGIRPPCSVQLGRGIRPWVS